jgi:glutathione S-transferase
MLALYHFDRSTAAARVRLALAEKGLQWESRYVETGLDKREQHDPDYLKLNPRGVVPTLVHDDKVIRESLVIMEYLDDAFPTPALRPADPSDRARMRLWMKQVDEFLHVDSRIIGHCIVMRYATMKADPAVVKRHYHDMPDDVRRENDLINIDKGVDSPLLPGALKRFKRLFTDIDRATAKAPFLVGDALSLADLALVVYVDRLAGLLMAPLWESLKHFNDWHGRIKARPSFAEAVTKWHDTGATGRNEHAVAAFPRVKQIWDAA